MVKIRKGDLVIAVTNGAYENTYKKLGFEKVDEDKVEESVVVEDTVEEQVEETEEDFSELLEKPISSWTKAEIKEFATEKGIDISGTKNAGEAKDVIKAWLEENE